MAHHKKHWYIFRCIFETIGGDFITNWDGEWGKIAHSLGGQISARGEVYSAFWKVTCEQGMRNLVATFLNRETHLCLGPFQRY